MVLPLIFSYSATILRKEASSSRRKPWSQNTVAVLAAALAMNGRPSVPAAASPTDTRRTERLLSSLMLNPALICSLAGEINSPDHRGCSVIEARPSLRHGAPAGVASGHGDTPGNCLSPGKRFRHTTQVM